MNIKTEVANGEITQSRLFDPFLKPVLRYLRAESLRLMAKDLYSEVESLNGPNWRVIEAYHAVKGELESRGHKVSIAGLPHDKTVQVTKTNIPIE